jgi:hypothetical protein
MDNISIIAAVFSIGAVMFAVGSLLMERNKHNTLLNKHLHHHANITFKDGRVLDFDIENLRNNSGEAEKIMDAFSISSDNKR